jgi:predicted nucleic acid-binding protein
MDIVLDSNIYLADLRLKSNRFANFFDYVRRARSTILLPALVRDEIVQKQSEKCGARAPARVWPRSRVLAVLENLPTPASC